MLLICNKQLCYTVCDYYMFILNNQHLPAARRVSSVDIATRYGLEGQVIEFRWGRDFPHPSIPALGPIQPPTEWVLGPARE